MDDWETIRSVEDAHDLLVRSDLAAAGADGHVPARNLETTRRLVRNGAVHGLRREGRLVVTVALLEDPTFQPNPDCLEASRPLYMCRLSVAPEAADPLLGYRAVRHAIKYAREHRHDVLRSEVNPDVTRVSGMLRSLGFAQRGPECTQGRAPTAQMELVLAGPDGLR